MSFEISEPAEETTVILSDDFGSDLPTLALSSLGLGRSSQMEIPIIQSDIVNVRPTVTIIGSWFESGDIMSETIKVDLVVSIQSII